MTIPAADRTFADEEALTWLRQNANRGVETSGAELARHWGWSRSKVYRRLKQWADAGVISRRSGPDGNSLITSASVAVSAPELPASLPVAASEPMTRSIAARPEEARAADYALLAVRPPVRRVGVTRLIGALVLAGIACAIAWYGLNINAWYGATLGKTAEASLWLAGLSVAADALALVLPAAARTLWQDGKRSEAAMAWGLWGTTIVTALMATIGFAAVNIADTTAARGSIASERAGLVSLVARLRTERDGIAETRSAVTIAAEIQRAQPRAASAWHATAGCTDVTRPQSGEACAEVLKLRQAAGTAQRRDALDAEVKEAEARLARLPALTTADPQAETAASLMNWLTADTARVRPADVHMARVLAMTLLPQLSGLVFMLAMALWQPGRRHDGTG